MKKFGLSAATVAVVMLAAISSPAALISEWTFDSAQTAGSPPFGMTSSDLITGAVGGSARVTMGTGGHIGDGTLTTTNDPNGSSFRPSQNVAAAPYADVWGTNTHGLWTGSITLWTKMSSGAVAGAFGGKAAWFSQSFDDFGGLGVGQLQLLATANNNIKFHIKAGASATDQVLSNYTWNTTTDGTNTLTAFDDNNWHQIVATWNLTSGATGTGSLGLYYDGTALAVTPTVNSVTSSVHIGGSANGSARVNANSWGETYGNFNGSTDDLAVWNEKLTTAQVKAIYDTGNASLNYNAKNLQDLFDLYTGAMTSVTIGANTWTRYGTGIAFDGTGALSGGNTLALGTAGGVTFAPVSVDVTWTGAGNSTWSTATGLNNWKATVGGAAANYANGTNVTFDDSATGTTTADIAANVTPTSVTFNNSGKTYTVTGASFGIAGAATVLKQGTGTTTIGSVNSYTGVTTVEAGKLILQGSAKAMVPVITGGGANIKGGMLVLDYLGEADPVTNVKSLLTASYNSGAWNTGKFQSTTANSARGLGWSDNTGTSKINVAYTLYGDANLDGTTNFTDLSKLLSKYNQTGVWSDGDFNYDGTVNFLDLSKMLSNYNQSVGTLTPSPEPSSVIMLATMAGLMGAWVIRWRRR